MTTTPSYPEEKKSIPRNENTKYMSNQAKVEKVVHKFMNMTLKELREVQRALQGNYIDNIITSLTESRTALLYEKLQDITYIELVCLLNETHGTWEWITGYGYDDDDYDEVMQHYMYYAYLNMAHLLMAGESISPPIKLFLAIPLRSFYVYLDSISNESGLLDQLKDIAGRCKYSDSYTIGNFIREKCAVINKPWWIYTSIKEYKQDILEAYSDIGKLLFDSFQGGFSDQYPMYLIYNTYTVMEEYEERETDWFIDF